MLEIESDVRMILMKFKQIKNLQIRHTNLYMNYCLFQENADFGAATSEFAKVIKKQYVCECDNNLGFIYE